MAFKVNKQGVNVFPCREVNVFRTDAPCWCFSRRGTSESKGMRNDTHMVSLVADQSSALSALGSQRSAVEV